MAASDADGSFVPSSGGLKDTTHIAVIDADGNVFDATPSGGWTGGGVILGETGIGLSTRGEQFWLDPDRANQIRPRARPRYTLTPSIVFKDGEPLMAIGTPGGDNQDQTILQSFLNVVEFWSDWYPNLHDALAWPRVRTQHLHGSFWPHARRLQPHGPRIEDIVRGGERAAAAGTPRERGAAVRNVRLRDGGAHRSGNRQPPGRRRPAPRLLRASVLTERNSAKP